MKSLLGNIDLRIVTIAFAIAGQLLANQASGQDCDDNVPHFDADLTGAADETYFSPSIQRQGNCCGTQHPDQCISFSIMLHEDAVGIIFDICEGAVPPGALFYQVECGPPVQVGNVICLDGPGPHQLTFCKPGNNQNVYCITSIPAPGVGPPQVASDGCTAEIWSVGYNPESVNWTSVFPGAEGQYNDLLSCTQCEEATVTAPTVFPPYVDFMVCGTTIGSCATTPHCDTTRVYFEASLAVIIEPENPVICYGATGTSVTAIGSGGFPPYTFTWSNGATGESTFIDAPGTYTVTVTDTSDCPPGMYTFIVTEYQMPLSVSAGQDLVVCHENAEVTLNATYTGLPSGIWSGGAGSFIPDEEAPDAVYMPSEEDYEAGEVTLFYTLYPEGGCPIASDSVLIQFAPFEAATQAEINHVSCFGAGDGNISLDISGSWAPYEVQWISPAITGNQLNNLEPGSYDAVVTNAAGCSDTLTFEIFTPNELEVSVAMQSDITCYGAGDGWAVLQVSGGTPMYNFEWSDGESNPVNTNLEAGNYGVIVTDANGCTDETALVISEPLPLEVTLSGDTLICPGDLSFLTAIGSGGTGALQYHWNQGLGDSSTHEVAVSEDTEYTVYVSDENGCTSASAIITTETITMSPELLSTFGGEPVCAGNSTQISALYEGIHPPYSYSWNNQVGDGPGPHTVTPEGTTTYEVTVTDQCNNEVTATITAIIYMLPAASLSDVNDVTCHGMDDGSATTTVTGGTPGYSYEWSDGIDHGPAASNLAPGMYMVTISDSHECPDSLQFQINEPEPLVLTASADTLICPGESFMLSASATGGFDPYEFNWSHNFGNAPQHTAQLDESTVITVSVTDSSGCTTPSISLPVEVINFIPGLMLINAPEGICFGESADISAWYTGNHPPYEYNWNQGLPDTNGPHTVSPEQSVNYTVTVTDICENTFTSTIPLDVYANPVAVLPPLIAEGCIPLNVVYHDPHNDPSQHNYLWIIDENQQLSGHPFSFTFEEPGNYEVSLIVTSNNGCTTSSETAGLIIARPTPVAAFSASPWEAGIDNPLIQFNDLSQGTITGWEWNFGDGESESIQNPAHLYPDTGSFAVELIVENQFGCSDTAMGVVVIKPVYEIIIPNAFSPTGGGNGYYDPNDTSNDIFYPFADYVADFRLSIFNRWGELIFESLDIRKGWNGEYRGAPCQQDVYVYKAEFTFTDGVQITRVGDVTLFR